MNIPYILIGALFLSIPFALWFIHYQLNGIRNSIRNRVTYGEQSYIIAGQNGNLFVEGMPRLGYIHLIDVEQGYLIFGKWKYPRILCTTNFTETPEGDLRIYGYEVYYHDIEQQRKAARDIIKAWDPYAADNIAFSKAFPNINPNTHIYE